MPLSSLIRSCYSDSSFASHLDYRPLVSLPGVGPFMICCLSFAVSSYLARPRSHQLVALSSLPSLRASTTNLAWPRPLVAECWTGMCNTSAVQDGCRVWAGILCALFTWSKTTKARSSHISGGVSSLTLSQWQVWHLERGCQLHQTLLHNLNSTLGRLPGSCATCGQALPSFPLVICPTCFRHLFPCFCCRGDVLWAEQPGLREELAWVPVKGSLNPCPSSVMLLADLSSPTAAASSVLHMAGSPAEGCWNEAAPLEFWGVNGAVTATMTSKSFTMCYF